MSRDDKRKYVLASILSTPEASPLPTKGAALATCLPCTRIDINELRQACRICPSVQCLEPDP